MLLFTPEVLAWLQLFELTYRVNGGLGWLAWQRESLLEAGGIEDQPVKDIEALALIARVENAALRRGKKREPKQTKKRDA